MKSIDSAGPPLRRTISTGRPLGGYRLRLVAWRHTQTHGVQPFFFAWLSIVDENGTPWFRFRLRASEIDVISETLVGFFELPFAGFRIVCRLEFPLGPQHKPLHLGFKMGPRTLQFFQSVDGGPHLLLQPYDLNQGDGDGLNPVPDVLKGS